MSETHKVIYGHNEPDWVEVISNKDLTVTEFFAYVDDQCLSPRLNTLSGVWIDNLASYRFVCELEE